MMVFKMYILSIMAILGIDVSFRGFTVFLPETLGLEDKFPFGFRPPASAMLV